MLLYWLWLAGCKDIGDGTKTALVRHFEDPEHIFRADKQTLRAADIEGLTEKQADVLLRHDLRDAERVLTDCMRLGIRVLTFGDAQYPKRLKELYDAPVVLFYKGTLPDFDDLTTVALVGTRHASDYGRQAAARLGGEIAAAGGLVVSGLAEGIDAAAMGAALAFWAAVRILFTHRRTAAFSGERKSWAVFYPNSPRGPRRLAGIFPSGIGSSAA